MSSPSSSAGREGGAAGSDSDLTEGSEFELSADTEPEEQPCLWGSPRQRRRRQDGERAAEEEEEEEEAAAAKDFGGARQTFANSRERWRQQNMNGAFAELRRLVPTYPPDKKLSKTEVLRLAIRYIKLLTRILRWQSWEQSRTGATARPGPGTAADDHATALPSGLLLPYRNGDADGDADFCLAVRACSLLRLPR